MNTPVEEKTTVDLPTTLVLKKAEMTITLADEKAKDRIVHLLAQVLSIQVTDDASMEEMALVIRELKEIRKSVEDGRKAVKKPHDDNVKEIQAFAKKFTVPIDNGLEGGQAQDFKKL